MIFLLFFIIFFSGDICCEDNAWNGIRPMKTTREELELAIGKSEGTPSKLGGKYKVPEGELIITYTRGSCECKDTNWDVPESTVMLISFHPSPKFPLTKLEFDKSKFGQRPYGDVTFLNEYYNNEIGISIIVDIETGEVVEIEYRPKIADSALACKRKT